MHILHLSFPYCFLYYFWLIATIFLVKAGDQLFYFFFFVYIITTVYVGFLTLRIKSDLAKFGDIQKTTRLFGFPLLLTIASGNIFFSLFCFYARVKNKDR